MLRKTTQGQAVEETKFTELVEKVNSTVKWIMDKIKHDQGHDLRNFFERFEQTESPCTISSSCLRSKKLLVLNIGRILSKYPDEITYFYNGL
ncbi:hypothetical protein Trydic_g2729 [Trypoxylus dichotomus]